MPSQPLESALAPVFDFQPPRVSRLQLSYQAQERIHLKSPAAHVWRGQLGEFLHRIAPERHHQRDLSLYQRLFRTPRSAIDLPASLSEHMLGRIGLGGEFVPHPFVLRMTDPPVPGVPLDVTPGETLSVDLVLVENAVEMLPALYSALDSIGKSGLGSKTPQRSANSSSSSPGSGGGIFRGRAVLRKAVLRRPSNSPSGSHDEEGHLLYNGTTWHLPPEGFSPSVSDAPVRSASEPLTLQFWTPLRLQHRGRLVRPGRLSIPALGAAFFRRIAGLSACYRPTPPSERALHALHEAFLALGHATEITSTDLRWVSDERYSRRQNTKQPLGGLFGSVHLTGPRDALSAWARITSWTRLLHIGKKTSFGLGRVEIANKGPS